jgi:hypothetical protein
MTMTLAAAVPPQVDAIGVAPWVWLAAVRDTHALTVEEKRLVWVLASHADEFGRISACSRAGVYHYWISDLGAGIRGASACRRAVEVKGFIREVLDGDAQLTVPTE